VSRRSSPTSPLNLLSELRPTGAGTRIEPRSSAGSRLPNFFVGRSSAGLGLTLTIVALRKGLKR